MKTSPLSPFRRAVRLFTLLGLSSLAAGQAEVHAAYVFDTIALTGPEFHRVGSTSTADDGEVSINDAGVVSFIGVKNSTYGVYTGTGGPLTTITTETTTVVAGNVVRRELFQPAINATGVLAWLRYLDGSGSSVQRPRYLSPLGTFD